MKTTDIKKAKNQLESMERAISRLSRIISEARYQVLRRTEEDDINGTTHRTQKMMSRALAKKRDLQFEHTELLQNLWSVGIFL